MAVLPHPLSTYNCTSVRTGGQFLWPCRITLNELSSNERQPQISGAANDPKGKSVLRQKEKHFALECILPLIIYATGQVFKMKKNINIYQILNDKFPTLSVIAADDMRICSTNLERSVSSKRALLLIIKEHFCRNAVALHLTLVR